MRLSRVLVVFIAFGGSHGQTIRGGQGKKTPSYEKRGEQKYPSLPNISTSVLADVEGDGRALPSTARRLVDPLQLPVFLSAAMDDSFISKLTPDISRELMEEVMKLVNSKFSNIQQCGTERMLWMNIPWCIKFKSMNMQSYDTVSLWNRASGDSSSFITVIQARVIKAQPNIQVSLGGACAVDMYTDGDFILSSLTLQLRVGISEDGKVLSMDAEDVTIGNMQLDIDPRYNNACSVIAFPITKILDIYAQDIVNNQKASMENDAKTALSSAVRSSKAYITSTVIKFSQEGELTIVPAIRKMRKDTHLLTDTHVSFYSHLTSPDWRAGYGYTPTFHVTGELPQASTSHVANINIRASGINALIDSLWYLTWASIATDPAGKFSSVSCHTQFARSLLDPCPFPAYIYDVCATEGFLCNMLVGGGVFNTNAQSHAVLPPPRFIFENGMIVGKAHPSVAIVTHSLMREVNIVAELEVECIITASMPTFDTANGTFSGLEILSIDLGVPVLTKQTGFFNLAGDRFVDFTTETLEHIIQFFLPKINEHLTETLKGSPPLILPTWENAPIESTAIDMRFSGASTVEGVAQSVQGESYLYFGSDVSMSVRPMEDVSIPAGR